MLARSLLVAVLIAGAGAYGTRAGSTEAPVERQPLPTLPLDLDGWHGLDSPPLEDDVLGQLGVDDYINRQYADGAGIPVGVYVGYYASQRQGDTIHSPQNCLPGAGWRPVEQGEAHLTAGGRDLTVNRFVIQKGLDKQVVYYWYQGRGRVIANEYANKALLMFDAARLNRTNGGLVRLITPVVTTTDEAARHLSRFVASIFPQLDRYLP
jgi:EpsI family protein